MSRSGTQAASSRFSLHLSGLCVQGFARSKNTLLFIFLPLSLSHKHLTPPLYSPNCPRVSCLVAFLASGTGFYLLRWISLRRRGDLKCSCRCITPGTAALWADEDWFCLSGLNDFLRNNSDQPPLFGPSQPRKKKKKKRQTLLQAIQITWFKNNNNTCMYICYLSLFFIFSPIILIRKASKNNIIKWQWNE